MNDCMVIYKVKISPSKLIIASGFNSKQRGQETGNSTNPNFKAFSHTDGNKPGGTMQKS